MASLRRTLLLNGLSCLVFGAAFLIWPGEIGAFLGSVPAFVLMAIGAGLLVNGLHLMIVARAREIRSAQVLWFSAGDLLWWLASLALIVSQLWITTDLGVLLTWVVALGVAGFGLTQLWHMGCVRTGKTNAEYWRAMARSWTSLPLWVKIWLIALNGVFLFAMLYVPSDLSRVVLTAYVASGPLAFALVFLAGGLSRVVGLGHLIPWAPLLIWLAVWLQEAGGAHTGQMTYATVLLAMVVICLGFDIYDLVRWRRGDRAVIGENNVDDLKA